MPILPVLSLLSKRWSLQEVNERNVLALMQRYELSEIMARILTLREHTVDSVEHFLIPRLRHFLPNPMGLQDMKKSILRVVQAIQQKEKIVIFGDYDVDGATSSALLSRFFFEHGIPVDIYIPDRITEGYGPNVKAFEKLAQDKTNVVIAVDCGTVSFEPLTAAQRLGLDVIIIDHHAPEIKLPPAFGLINPHRLDEVSEVAIELRKLASVGLCFLFVAAIQSHLKEIEWYHNQTQPDLLSLLDLVALGTVCDVMPLTGLNRAFVSQGLKVMERRQNIGLTALADVAQLDEAPQAYHLGFTLGPRINAAGRLGTSHLGAKLLSTNNEEEAKSIALQLNALNEERRALEKETLHQATTMASNQENSSISYVYDATWHEGIIGIIAGRLKDQFNKPAFVMTKSGDIIKGSARSVVGLDLGNLIHKAVHKGLLVGGGGHPMAAGFTVLPDNLESLFTFLSEEVIEKGKKVDLTPVVTLDAILSLSAINVELVKALQQLSPTGVGNPTPKFLLQNVTISSAQMINDQHVRCTLKQMSGETLSAIAFRIVNSPLADALLKSKNYALDVVVTLKYNTWNGHEKVQVQIEDAMFAEQSLQTMAG